jgi:TRAP-type C4-dicarboxylate transport system substrate-binding protein
LGTLVAAILAAWLLIPAAQTLRLNESLGPGRSEEAALNVFKNHVEDGSGSDLQIALYLQDQLGNPHAPAECLMTGPLDLYSGARNIMSRSRGRNWA